MTSVLRIVLAATALAAATAGGYAGYRLLSSSSAPTARSAAAAPAATQPSAPGQGAGRTIPERLPDFTLADRDGKPRRLSEWADRPLLVNFWATWCAPCRREIPLLKQLRADRAGDGLEVIGIAVDFREAVLEYAGEIALDYPLLIGEQDGLEAAAAFGMDLVLPFSVFSDRNNRIVTVKVGELHAQEANYILDTIREVDADRLDLGEARRLIATRLQQLAASRAVDPTPAETASN